MALRCIITSYFAADRGAIAPMTAFMFMTLMGMTGLAVDVGVWMHQKTQLQTAADAAALAGAYELANGQSNNEAEEAALREATANGYSPDDAASPIDIDITGDTDPDDEETTKVAVTLRQNADSWFSQLLSEQAVVTRVSATAEVEAEEGVFCMLSLDPDADNAISISGNVSVDAQGCGMASNSDSDSSLHLNGSVFVNVGDVSLVGNVDDGGVDDFYYTSMRTGAAQKKDPYADLEVNHTSVCTADEIAAGMIITSTAELLAAPHYPVLCGNITFKNGDIVMPSNTYIIESGNLDTNGNGSLTATASTIIFTNSATSPTVYGSMKSTGTFDISLSAPTTGDWAGIAIFQDPNTPDDDEVNKMTGTGNLQVDGVIYMPTRSLEFGGNGAVTSAADVCSVIISKTISFHGNPTIGSNCQDKNIQTIGTPAVRLIL